SCAERKSSTVPRASSTASRCGVVRGAGESAVAGRDGSVLVIVRPFSGQVYGVPVAVVHVVDVVIVLHRDVAAVRPVLVGVGRGGLVLLGNPGRERRGEA